MTFLRAAPSWTPRPVVVAAALAAVAGLAGCGAQVAGTTSALSSPPAVLPAVPSPLAVASPPAAKPCPDAGVVLSAGPANAAMGLRVQAVTLTNCGRRARVVEGYPRVRLLDADGDPVKVAVDHGAERITTAVRDPGPRRVTVRPGRSASFTLVWRNTYDDPSRLPAAGATVVVTAGPGGREHRVTPDAPLDLGSTGRLGVTAWQESPPRPADEAARGGRGS
ncbi:DUF4232 domain-containing protein [Nonomuraea sp. NPDC050383]|uniref:DUF4232 domain-containing protein n=1 Tax=Nonomuraea sp. NPDC050383 TaxID=3364362 RepID=UPI003795F13A